MKSIIINQYIYKQYKKFSNKNISTEDTDKMADFVLSSIFLRLRVYEQISKIAIGMKFVPSHTCSCMDYFKAEILKS